jgi:hypothetical protein
MRNRLAHVLVWLFLGSVLFAAPTFQQQNANSDSKEEWKVYSYESDGFAVSAPGEPTLTKQNQDSPGGKVEVHNYAIELGNNSGVMISTTLFPNVQGDPKTLVQGAKNGAVDTMNAKITSEKEITIDGYPGVQFEADSQNFHIRSRMYVVKDRLLMLLAIAPNESKIPPTADRVFDSFKLKEPPAK